MNPTSAPVAHLSRRYRFSASHRLHVESLGAERNRELFGKCNNPFGHGHNYTVQVTIAGPVDAATGMVVNLADLDDFAATQLLERFDQSNLNEHEVFANTVPSTENLCEELWRIFERFTAQHPGAELKRIRVEETNNNSFEYFGDRKPHTLAGQLFERPTSCMTTKAPIEAPSPEHPGRDCCRAGAEGRPRDTETSHLARDLRGGLDAHWRGPRTRRPGEHTQARRRSRSSSSPRATGRRYKMRSVARCSMWTMTRW